MIDFSTLQGLTIPEGNVTQIDDASGRVLWSAKRNAKVTVTSECVGISGDTAQIIITSPEPFAPIPQNLTHKVTTWYVYPWEGQNFTIEIPVGSTIECTVTDTKQSNRCYITVNGVEVLSDPGTYLYTVTRDVTVDVSDRYSMGEYGVITITEEGR